MTLVFVSIVKRLGDVTQYWLRYAGFDRVVNCLPLQYREKENKYQDLGKRGKEENDTYA